MADMEGVQAVAVDGGATKLIKKPGGLSVARGTPADDGGGQSAPSRAQARNGRTLSHSASTAASSASNRAAAASNGRSNSSSLLLRRRRLKRNLSATAAAASSPSAVTAKMSSALSSASLHTRSLDRKTLLRHRQNLQLQPADRDWVRADLHRGCIHVHHRLTASYPRPVLCTMDTTAGEVALRLSVKSHSKSSSVLRIFARDTSKTDQNGNCKVKCGYDESNAEDSSCKHRDSAGVRGRPSDRLRLLLMEDTGDRQQQQDVDEKLFSPQSESQDNITCSLSDLTSNIDTPNEEDSEHKNGTDSFGLNSGSDVESCAFDDLSSGAQLSEHRDSLSDDMILGTEASILSPSFDSATEGHDMYGSSSDELELDCPVPSAGLRSVSRHHSNGIPSANANYKHRSGGLLTDTSNSLGQDISRNTRGGLHPSNSAGSLSRDCSTGVAPDGQDLDNKQGAVKLGQTEHQNEVSSDSSPALYVQLHGETVRRLSPDERPLQIQNDFLFKLGFKDPWRVQEEGLDTEIGSLLRFYAGN